MGNLSGSNELSNSLNNKNKADSIDILTNCNIHFCVTSLVHWIHMNLSVRYSIIHVFNLKCWTWLDPPPLLLLLCP